MLFRAHIISSLLNRTRPPLHNLTSFPNPFVYSHVIVLGSFALDPRRHVQTARAQCQLHSRKDLPSLPPGPFLHLNCTTAQQPLIRPLRGGPCVSAYSTYGCTRSYLFLPSSHYNLLYFSSSCKLNPQHSTTTQLIPNSHFGFPQLHHRHVSPASMAGLACPCGTHVDHYFGNNCGARARYPNGCQLFTGVAWWLFQSMAYCVVAHPSALCSTGKERYISMGLLRGPGHLRPTLSQSGFRRGHKDHRRSHSRYLPGTVRF
jgi:hypothetical protein